MVGINATFLCVGGFFTPVVPVAPDGAPREIDGIHFFGPEDVACETGADKMAVDEAYAVFLQEVGDGIHGTEAARDAEKLLRTRFAHLSDEHFEQYKALCRQRGVNPFGSHMWADCHWDDRRGTQRLEIEMTVDGLYAKALGTGDLLKTFGPEWCGSDHKWSDVWDDDKPPVAARFGVLRRGMEEPLYRTVFWRDYAPYQIVNGERVLDPAWARMPAFMLAKVCEAVTLRRAFADILDGFYSPEEMAQARPRAQARGGALMASAVSVEDLPKSARAFHIRLIRYGFQDPIHRARLVDRMRAKFPMLYARNMPGFYDKVFVELRADADNYGAVIPSEDEPAMLEEEMAGA